MAGCFQKRKRNKMDGKTEKQLLDDVGIIKGVIIGVKEELDHAREDRKNLFDRMRKSEVCIAKNKVQISNMKKISGLISAGVVAVIYAIKLFMGWDR